MRVTQDAVGDFVQPWMAFDRQRFERLPVTPLCAYHEVLVHTLTLTRTERGLAPYKEECRPSRDFDDFVEDHVLETMDATSLRPSPLQGWLLGDGMTPPRPTPLADAHVGPRTSHRCRGCDEWSMASTLRSWCRRWGSNPHDPEGSAVFKCALTGDRRGLVYLASRSATLRLGRQGIGQVWTPIALTRCLKCPHPGEIVPARMSSARSVGYSATATASGVMT